MISHAALDQAVVRVETDKMNAYNPPASGTGFFAAPGYVLTCWHVVEGCERIELFREGWDQPLEASIVEGSEEKAENRDFVLLEVQNSATTPLAVQGLDPDTTNTEGEISFRARGCPLGRERKGLTGTLNILDDDKLTLTGMQFLSEWPSKPTGFSGGPVVIKNRVRAMIRDFIRTRRKDYYRPRTADFRRSSRIRGGKARSRFLRCAQAYPDRVPRGPRGRRDSGQSATERQ